MLNMLLYTGIRGGELSALKWNDIDFKNKTMKIDESITSKKYHGTTKTKKSVRIIPLNDILISELKQKRNALKPSNDTTDYVFINRNGNTFGSAYVSTRFRVLKREIESVYNMDLTGITPHCFRHTFATAGIASGVDIVTMKDLLGHANSKMLIDTYAHANLGIKKDSVNKITESYGIIDT